MAHLRRVLQPSTGLLSKALPALTGAASSSHARHQSSNNPPQANNVKPNIGAKRKLSMDAQTELKREPVFDNLAIPFRKDYSQEKCTIRREWAEEFSGANLDNIGSWWPDQSITTESLQGNIEQPIGTAKIPIGLAGPLLFEGAHAEGHILAPIATTEGALVASLCRGAKAISDAGGVKTWATQQRMTRGPMFQCEDPIQAMKLGEWAQDHIHTLQDEVICKFSRHAKLKEILTPLDMDMCHMLFRFETGDAAGQNQTTVCTWECIKWIRENAPKAFPPGEMNIKYMSIEGNVAADKKTSSFNALMGRGTSVTATAEIPEDILRSTVGITSDMLDNACYYSKRISERINQQCGFNVNVSNTLAAIFTATGQDIACVHESSMARVDFLKRHNHPEGGVKISMYIPSLVVGTVGGGTSLPTQKECLQLMGCYGSGKVKKFAEVVAGYCLALDLSTYSAVSAGHFADAHERYGRNRPT